jgi:hypothetical protein
MSDYVNRFEAMAKGLGSREHFQIVELTPQPAATKKALEAFEQKLGASLGSPIREFYGEANGLKLHWEVDPLVSPEVAKDLRAKSKDYYVGIAEYVGEPFANINILPLEDSVLKSKPKELARVQEQESVEFAGSTYPFDDFIARLKPFDLMSEEYCMAFFLEDGSGDPPVLLLGEGCTDWRNSRLTDFGSYLEMLLVTRGIVEAREKIVSEPEGHQKPRLTGDAAFWEKRYTPDLFA